MVTFTHTISVFFLGLTTLFLSQYVLPEKIYPGARRDLGTSIVWIGATLFFKRLRAAGAATRTITIIITTTITLTAALWCTIMATATFTATCRKATSAWAA